MATPKIGFIGLGRMGGPMSLRLIQAGFDLVVFDTNPDASAPQKTAGAVVASSSKDVFDSSDLAFVSLPTPDIVEKVVLGERREGLARQDRGRSVNQRTRHGDARVEGS